MRGLEKGLRGFAIGTIHRLLYFLEILALKRSGEAGTDLLAMKKSGVEGDCPTKNPALKYRVVQRERLVFTGACNHLTSKSW